MSRKHFSALLVLAVVVAVVIALLVPGKTGRDDLFQADLLIPGLGDGINQASLIEVTTPGNVLAVTLVRGERNWTIDELAGYPADFAPVRDLLAGLAQARVIEAKTSNPNYYARLGVEDVSGEDASGVLVRVTLGGEVIAVILGNEAQGRDGMYMRLADSASSVLVDVMLDVSRGAIGWADKEIADLSSVEVAEVEIIHPDGDWIMARKISADDTDYQLENLPEGRELKSTWSVNSLGNALASLSLDSVRPDSEVDFSGAIRVRVLTFTGMEVMVEAIEDEEDQWIRLNASAPVDSPDEQGDEVAEQARADLKAAVEEFNARVAAWAYRIPSYKFDGMIKRLEDLLKPMDTGEAGAS